MWFVACYGLGITNRLLSLLAASRASWKSLLHVFDEYDID